MSIDVQPLVQYVFQAVITGAAYAIVLKVGELNRSINNLTAQVAALSEKHMAVNERVAELTDRVFRLEGHHE